jgi:hypothetical protein
LVFEAYLDEENIVEAKRNDPNRSEIFDLSLVCRIHEIAYCIAASPAHLWNTYGTLLGVTDVFLVSQSYPTSSAGNNSASG